MPISSAELVDLWEDYGAFLRLAEDEATAVAAIEAEIAGIVTDVQANAHDELLQEVFYLRDQRIKSAESAVSRVAARAYKILSHPLYVLEEASLGDSPTRLEVLEAFFDLMGVHSKTFQKNTVTIGSVTMTTDNADCGRLFFDKKLDGVSEPTIDAEASSRLLGLDSEIAVSDSFVATCEASEPRSSTQFVVRGTLAPTSRKSQFGATGYGDGPTLVPIDYSGLLTNGDFSRWASLAPFGWTTVTGTPGTHFAQETGGANIWTGANSLKLLGNASLAAIEIEQSLASRPLRPGKRYALAAWVKGNTSLTAGDLKIRVTWDGASLSAGEFIDVPVGTLDNASTFAFYSSYITIPLNKPTGLRLEILFDNTPSAHPIYVSDVAFGEATYFDGICGAAKEGKGRFSIGDTAAFDVANDEAGKFQTFHRDFYGFQFPSSATPNIADSLIS